jgi:hypothetical protein
MNRRTDKEDETGNRRIGEGAILSPIRPVSVSPVLHGIS